jgi:hypothetical protein
VSVHFKNRRRQGRPAHPLRVEPAAGILDEAVETVRIQYLVDLRLERVGRTLRQRRGCDPELTLIFTLPLAHRHTLALPDLDDNNDITITRASRPDFHHGLLGPRLNVMRRALRHQV